jgi:hypothetical protein
MPVAPGAAVTVTVVMVEAMVVAAFVMLRVRFSTHALRPVIRSG